MSHCQAEKNLYRLSDFNGLYLEVKSNGKEAWRYRFKLNDKTCMFALGEYPVDTGSMRIGLLSAVAARHQAIN